MCTERAFEGSYNSVRRFVNVLKEAAPKRVCRMEVEPGEEAQIDYGITMIVEDEGGRLKHAQRLASPYSFPGGAIARPCPVSTARAS